MVGMYKGYISAVQINTIINDISLVLMLLNDPVPTAEINLFNVMTESNSWTLIKN